MANAHRAGVIVGVIAAAGCAAVKSEKFSEQKCDVTQRVAHRSACRTFEAQSENAANAPFPRSVQKGVAYFLPKQKLRITAVRTIKPLPDLAKARKDYAEARTKRDGADAAARASAAAAAAADAEVEALKKTTPPPSPAVIAAAEQRAAQATLDARADAAALAAATAAFAKADAELALRLEEPHLKTVPETKIELKILDAEPDPEALYYATPRHGITRDDTLKIVVGPNGLLASSNVVAEDRTDEIIVEAAGAAALFLRGPSGVALSSARTAAPKTEKECPRENTEPLTFEIVVDPADLADTANTAGTADKADTAKAADTAKTAKAAKARLEACFGYRITAEPAVYEKSNFAMEARPSYPGYAYRARIPWTITLSRYHGPDCKGDENCKSDEKDFVVEKAIVALLPNGGPVAYIPIKAAPFVKTVNDVTFKDGSIASWDNTRPSEALEAVRLPVKVAKQILSVPTELLQLKVDLSSKEKAIAEVQAAQIATETKLRLLQECLATEIRDGNDGGACIK